MTKIIHSGIILEIFSGNAALAHAATDAVRIGCKPQNDYAMTAIPDMHRIQIHLYMTEKAQTSKGTDTNSVATISSIAHCNYLA